MGRGKKRKKRAPIKPREFDTKMMKNKKRSVWGLNRRLLFQNNNPLTTWATRSLTTSEYVWNHILYQVLIFPFWCTKTTYRDSQPAQLGETGWCEAVQGTTSMGTRWNRTPVRNWNTTIDIKSERIGKGHANKDLLPLLWKRTNFTHFLTSTATAQQGKRSAHLFAEHEVED